MIIRQSKHIVMSNGVHVIVIPRNNPINPYTMGVIARDAGLTKIIHHRCKYPKHGVRPTGQKELR
jgi:hypothetical protein